MLTNILAQLIYFFIRLLNLTYRYEYIGKEHKPKKNETVVYALWHQNLVAAIFSHIGERFTMVVSASKDGELVAVTCEKLGHRPARGSSTRGGKKALLEIIKNVKQGFTAALTVDGPKGPPHVVKHGAIEIAKLCQSPIVSVSPYADKSWVFQKSWDQFRIPKPFSKVVIVYGSPIVVGENASKDDFENIALEVAKKIELGEEIAKAHLSRNN